MELKAWRITCRDDGYHQQCVVFAESRNDARRLDDRDCDCEFIDIRIVRAPSFDELSPGPVTAQQYLDQGWFWVCGYCEKPLYRVSNPVIIKDRVYCNRSCVVASRKSYNPVGAHESVVSLCEELDTWLGSSVTQTKEGVN